MGCGASSQAPQPPAANVPAASPPGSQPLQPERQAPVVAVETRQMGPATPVKPSAPESAPAVPEPAADAPVAAAAATDAAVISMIQSFTDYCLPVTDTYDAQGVLSVVSTNTTVDESYANFKSVFEAAGVSGAENDGRRVFCVLGGPGSGKGTLCGRAALELGLEHISTGQLLRNAVATEGGGDGLSAADLAEVAAAMETGVHVKDETMLAVLLAALGSSGGGGCASAAAPLLLDGFPGNTNQAQLLESHATLGRPAQVVLLDCPEDVMIARIQAR